MNRQRHRTDRRRLVRQHHAVERQADVGEHLAQCLWNVVVIMLPARQALDQVGRTELGPRRRLRENHQRVEALGDLHAAIELAVEQRGHREANLLGHVALLADADPHGRRRQAQRPVPNPDGKHRIGHRRADPARRVRRTHGRGKRPIKFVRRAPHQVAENRAHTGNVLQADRGQEVLPLGQANRGGVVLRPGKGRLRQRAVDEP